LVVLGVREPLGAKPRSDRRGLVGGYAVIAGGAVTVTV
jgi:hypothetical protein